MRYEASNEANSNQTKAGCSCSLTRLWRRTYKSVKFLTDKTAVSPPSQLLPLLFGACVPFFLLTSSSSDEVEDDSRYESDTYLKTSAHCSLCSPHAPTLHLYTLCFSLMEWNQTFSLLFVNDVKKNSLKKNKSVIIDIKADL